MRHRAPLPVVIATSVAVLAAGGALAGPSEPAAVVGWPPSDGLLVGEVVTGGMSGSDEFAEVYNASAAALDLGGLELVYVTSSGATVTRKAAWTGGTLLPAGGHLLVANSAGIFASMADALYSGGFAAAGGALVLRPTGGSPLDAVAWGDAANAFVEGTAAPAPAAGQSIERRPGGLDGNGIDSNDNAADFVVNAAPAAQNVSAPPVPVPQPTATALLTPTATPLPGLTPAPDLTPTPGTSPEPSAEPTPTPGGGEGPSPSASATATTASTESPTPAVTPDGTFTPAPTATPAGTPSVLTVAQARAEPDGSVVDVVATLTTQAGLVEGGTGAFIQDETAGISLYLASAEWPTLGPGALVLVHGTVDDRYAQRTLRLAGAGDVAAVGPGVMPVPLEVATGAAGESLEGRLISVVAPVVAAGDTLTDGFAVTVDDGSGTLRVVATAMSGIVPSDLLAQGWFRLSGVLGQRDSSGTGTEGYRLYLRSPPDVVPVSGPTPSPSPSLGSSTAPTPTVSPEPTPGSTATVNPTAMPTPAPTSSPSASPTAAPSPSPTPTAAPVVAIVAARTMALDSVVTVEGVATVEAGRIIDERSTVIQDATAGIAVRLPVAGWPPFGRGDLLRVTGVIAQRYGNLELRPASSSAVTVLGPGLLPAPRAMAASEFGEAMEGRLVRCAGVVVSVDAVGASGNFGLDLKDASGTMRVFVYGTTGIGRDSFVKGATVEVTGIEGQHAPSVGSTAGHRVWPRERGDVRAVAPTDPSAGPSVSPEPTPTPGPGARRGIPIAAAILAGGSAVVEGTVTTPPGFIDADGRRLVIEDVSGALLVRMPSAADVPPVGTRILASGSMGIYYGSPQLALSEPPVALGAGSAVPRVLGAPPGLDLAWRLVRVTGQVASVHRLGTTWRAEIAVAGREVPIYGAARSGIPSTILVEGRLATVTGVLRPPYPTATDRRPAIAPRSVADVSLGASAESVGRGPDGQGSGGAGPGYAPGSVSGAAIDVELAELGEHEGALVRVGGLVTSVSAERVVIDDGTATAAILLPADATGIAGDLRAGDPLNATGTVTRDREAWAVVPRSAVDIARVGRLGELAPLIPPTPGPADVPTVAAERLGSGGGWPLGTLPTALALTGTAVTVLAPKITRKSETNSASQSSDLRQKITPATMAKPNTKTT